jgi:magnesium transporter
MQILQFTNEGVSQGGMDAFGIWRDSKVGQLCVFAGEEDSELLKRVLVDLNVHPLAIQDVMRERHPPKYEVFSDYQLCLMRVLPEHSKGLFFHPVQVAVVVGDNWLVCRYQHPCKSIETFLSGLCLKKEWSGVGVLAWEIVVTVATHYLEWLMRLEGHISTLEDLMISASNDRILADVISMKTGLRKHRRNFLYLERVASQIREKGIGPDVLPHSPEGNDLYEKWERIYSMSSMFYEQLGDMIDGYISQSSYKLNVTMRVLTVITAIFIPLSFIAALYGMNFAYMPELQYHWAYFVLLAVMLGIGLGMVVWFRKIKWL